MKIHVSNTLMDIIRRQVWRFSLVSCLALSGVVVNAAEEVAETRETSIDMIENNVQLTDEQKEALKKAMEESGKLGNATEDDDKVEESSKPMLGDGDGDKKTESGDDFSLGNLSDAVDQLKKNKATTPKGGMNDGNIRDNPFGEILAVPLGYEGVEFFDFFMPYNTTVDGVGGWADDARPGKNGDTKGYAAKFKKPDVEELKKFKVGTGSDSSSSGSPFCRGNKITAKDKDGNYFYATFLRKVGGGDAEVGASLAKVHEATKLNYFEIPDKNGKTCKVFCSALPKALFNTNLVTKMDKTKYVWGLGNRGLLFDLILADGTQIHFAIADAAGDAHTNGYAEGWTGSSHDGVEYHLTPLKKEAYKQLFHCINPFHTFEVMTESGVPRSELGISDSNPVVCVRVYNATVDSKNFTIADGFEDAINKGAAPGMSSGATAVDSPNALKGYYDEMDLAAWSYLNGETVIDFNDRSDLSQSDLNALHGWEENVEANKFSLTKIIRYCVSFIGILFIVWGMFMYLAYWFDRVNTIIPISLVGFLSLGMFMISPDESECTFKLTDAEKGKAKTVNHVAIIEICLLAIGFGTLLVTGYMYIFVSWLIRLVFSLIK